MHDCLVRHLEEMSLLAGHLNGTVQSYSFHAGRDLSSNAERAPVACDHLTFTLSSALC